jgi:hypothetical protein
MAGARMAQIRTWVQDANVVKRRKAAEKSIDTEIKIQFPSITMG